MATPRRCTSWRWRRHCSPRSTGTRSLRTTSSSWPRRELCLAPRSADHRVRRSVPPAARAIAVLGAGPRRRRLAARAFARRASGCCCSAGRPCRTPPTAGSWPPSTRARNPWWRASRGSRAGRAGGGACSTRLPSTASTGWRCSAQVVSARIATARLRVPPDHGRAGARPNRRGVIARRSRRRVTACGCVAAGVAALTTKMRRLVRAEWRLCTRSQGLAVTFPFRRRHAQ